MHWSRFILAVLRPRTPVSRCGLPCGSSIARGYGFGSTSLNPAHELSSCRIFPKAGSSCFTRRHAPRHLHQARRCGGWALNMHVARARRHTSCHIPEASAPPGWADRAQARRAGRHRWGLDRGTAAAGVMAIASAMQVLERRRAAGRTIWEGVVPALSPTQVPTAPSPSQERGVV